MAASKNASAAKDRRKSGATAVSTPATGASSPVSKAANSLVIKLKADSRKLRAIWAGTGFSKDDTTPDKEAESESPAPSANLPAADPNVMAVDNASDSNSHTPAAATTPGPASQSSMGPPAEGPKNKKGGAKRSAAAARLNSDLKPRSKPGPKKRQKMTDDGPPEAGRTNGTAAHKLGPRANQGAINACLRALDLSGRPCRKWTKGSFMVKSFTGVSWEIERWKAPIKLRPVEEASASHSTAVSVEGSNKENNTTKDTTSQLKSEDNSVLNSSVIHGGPVNGSQDVEMPSAAPSVAAAPSPAPTAVAAA